MHIQIVTLTAKPEEKAAYAAFLADHQDASRAEPGVIEMRIHPEQEADNRFWAYERFADKAALAAHGKTAHTARFFETSKTALQQPPEVLTLNALTPLALETAEVTGGISMFFVFPVNPDMRETLIEAFVPYVEKTRAEEGNLRFDLHEIDGDKDRLAVFEIWRDMAAFEAHFGMPYAEEMGAIIAKTVPGEFTNYLVMTKNLGVVEQ
jgi:quinol monooxygenase YgiN